MCSKKQFDFIYKAKLDNNLYEHEFDHVFFGFSNDLPKVYSEEVEEFAYKTLEEVEIQIQTSPENYTEWFKICFKEVLKSNRNIV